MKKPSKKILKCLQEIISLEAYVNSASPGNPVTFPDIEGCQVRIFSFQGYGDLGVGYLMYICDRKFYPGLKWHTFLVNWESGTVPSISVKEICVNKIKIEDIMKQ